MAIQEAEEEGGIIIMVEVEWNSPWEILPEKDGNYLVLWEKIRVIRISFFDASEGPEGRFLDLPSLCPLPDFWAKLPFPKVKDDG